MGYKTINPEAGKATQFKPGSAGNPLGRGGKFKAVKDALKDRLTQVDEKTGLTNAEIIADRLIAMGKRGKMPAIGEILNRTEGKPIQPVQLDVGIDDKTAQTIVELAQTYKLLDPSSS